MGRPETARQRARSAWAQAQLTGRQGARHACVVIAASLAGAVPGRAGRRQAARAIGPGVTERADARLAPVILKLPGTCRTFAARPDQVRQARAFVRGELSAAPMADDMVLICSELASNSVLHSRAREPGGRFSVRAVVCDGAYACVEVADDGGPWVQHGDGDGRPHGLDIVRQLADAWGVSGDAAEGWLVWARIDWPGMTGDGT